MIAGGAPALRATERGKLSGIQALKGNSNPRLGKVWTTLVAAQIALSVAAVPIVAESAWETMRPAILGPGFDAAEFLTIRLATDPPERSDAAAARFTAISAELARQLEAKLSPAGVTASSYAPFEEPDVAIEVSGAGGGVHWDRKTTALNEIDDSFLDTFGIPLLTGRRLAAGDSNGARGAAMVNRTFADRLLGDANPLGRLVRITGPNGEPVSEHEIVGVVGDLFASSHISTMYRALSIAPHAPSNNGQPYQICLTLRTGRPIPPNLGNRAREVASALDPALRVDEVQPLDEIYRYLSLGGVLGGGIVSALALCGVLFSIAGVYTSMIFAVVQRRREIGIRSALGAPPWRLIAGAFRQVLIPVGIGVGSGGVGALLLDHYLSPLLLDPLRDGPALPWIPAVETLIFLIAAIALIGPVRRALRIDPVEALREI